MQRTYKVGLSRITLILGDITRSRAQVLVSSDDYLLSMGGGVSRALRVAGGSSLATDASKLVPAKLGDVVVSSAGDLPARYVFHAITIGGDKTGIEAATIVRQTTERAMQLLRALGCSSIAFPAIGAGAAGISYQVVAAEMAAVLAAAVIESDRAYQIELYLLDRFDQMKPDDFFVFFEEFAVRKQGLSSVGSPRAPVLSAPASSYGMMDPEHASQAKRRHEVYTMLRQLDASRNKLETILVSILTGADPKKKELSQVKKQLKELQELRRGYEAELDTSGGTAVVPRSVFLSSTSVDLKPHRSAVRRVIDGLRLVYVGMEEFLPEATPPVDLIRRKVTESSAFVGVLGMRYGYVYAGTGLSMTEMEYRQAQASSKPTHMFVMDDGAAITAGMVETNPEHYAKLVEFKRRVMADNTCSHFTSPEDLARRVRKTLSTYAKSSVSA